ncbi:PREDICTED: bidirectional sugar transporter SWEET10-like isoform X2 [Camelina sativa]|uniref:Bidirectional sugar transporter SWEET n=1 Tax=Camelina sativa TaxID=90675 RepID=A0ABM0UKQ1_CAMSA|nr:PREDICTED: bidirectional sugar transporter SWEET10-like isoform X1 [Camelina sativa]XP_010442556.1 PREDICTED: bidirectional sugar transporter SWEET10-like isoform X2 [Camelina sativa]
MAISQAVLATVFGILGNIISFFVCLAPIPTFIRIYKRKSSEGYQSVPYVISLFSAMLWLYYAMIKKDAMMLITINSFAFVVQIVYISLYFFYAPKKEKILTVKCVLFVDVFAFGLIFLLTYFLTHGNKRVQVLGYICMVFSLSVFVAPLGIIRKVIKTKSAEFMPFGLSFFLTLSAIMWFFYGLLLKDKNIALPNVLGFIFGVLQMILFVIYKKPGTKVLEPSVIKLQDISEHVVDVVRLSSMVCNSQMRTLVPQDSADMEDTIDLDEKIKGDIEKINNKEAFLISKN